MEPRNREVSWSWHALRRVTVIFALCALSGQAWAQDGRAIGVVGRGLDKTAEGGHRWALVIGVNDYTNLSRLNYARQDAKALVDALVQAGFDRDNIVLMTDDAGRSAFYPTRGNLRARINQVAQMVGPKDVLLIFFSGHGAERHGDGYLVPVDGDTSDLYSLVPLSWVRQTLETSAAKHRLLILDACHSGAKSGDATGSSAAALLRPLAGAAFATLCSCDVEQLSYEDDEAKRGVFTAGLIDGLRGAADRQAEGNRDGVVTASELWAYSSLHTRRWGLKSGKTQTPVLKGNFKGRIELARFLTAAELKEQRAALQKRLKMMQDLERDNAADEVRKEIVKLEAQLAAIVGDASGDGSALTGEMAQVYAAYAAAQKQVKELQALLEDTLKTYQPASKAVAKVTTRLQQARRKLERCHSARRDVDRTRREALLERIKAKEAAYAALTRELLPTASAALSLRNEIDSLQRQANKLLGLHLELGGGVTMELVLIEPGTFMMGSESGRSDEKPVHRVRISKPFYMGKYEVTQAQWKAVMGSNPSQFKDCGDDCPVETVSWEECRDFCRKVSQLTNVDVRLPSEAEWEYACRAGMSAAYGGTGTLGDMGWWEGNSDKRTHPIGRMQPNGFGLYDMHGNVLEWCQDVWHSGYSGAPSDMDAWMTGGNRSFRVLRGGSWYNAANDCRCANRVRMTPDYRDADYGLRIATGP